MPKTFRQGSITALCDRGRVVAHVAQQRDPLRFRVFANADLLDNVTRLVARAGYDGVANFDAVLSSEDGLGYLVECNPRFWYSIYLVMIAGLNFIDLALAPPRPAAETATLGGGEFRLSLRNCLSDPIAFALQRARSYDDSAVAVPVALMAAGARIKRPIAPRLAVN